jgi:ankyrin repeat protein
VAQVTPSKVSLETQPQPAKAAESGEKSAPGVFMNSADRCTQKTENGSLPSEQPVLADGYTEYARTFGTPVMGEINLVTPSAQLIPLSPPAKMEMDEKEAILRSQTPSSVVQNYPSLELVSHVRRKELPSAGTRPGEIEVVGNADSNLYLRPRSVREQTRKPEDLKAPDRNARQTETQQNAMALVKSSNLRRSSEFQFNAVSPNIFEAEAPISTSESDKVALQRLTTLRAKEPHLPPRPIKKQSFSHRLLSKAKSSKSSAQVSGSTGPAAEAHRFSLRLLTMALHDAVTEGDMQLVASILKLGADVNFECLEPPKHHHILEAAALSGHTHIVHYFIVMGADWISINQALISASRADYLDVAIKLVQHADMVSLQRCDNTSTQWKTHVTLFGRVARDTRIPPRTREKVLEFMIDQKQFMAARTVCEIHYDKLKIAAHATKKDERSIKFSYNAVQLLISLVDIELVAKILLKLDVDFHNRSFHDWAIPAEQWERTPQRALEMLRLLLSHSAPVDHAAESEGRNAMTPLAHSVAGGGSQAVGFLLELNADPECLIYELLHGEKRSMEAYTSMGWSAKQGRVEICRQLVSAGAIPWRTDAFNRTPLYWASKNGHFEVVEYLLSLDTKRSSIDNCLIAAIEGNEPEISKILIESGAVISSNTVSIYLHRYPRHYSRR